MTGAGQRVAVVTGASSGIGMETALAYATKGYAVVLAARRVHRLETVAEACRAANDQSVARTVETDVADPSQVQRLVDTTVAELGGIDVMVNNAGYGYWGRVWELDDEKLHRLMDVNFFGVFYGCRAVAPIMIARGGGHIFNVSSVIGKRGSPFNGAYCATKFAICGLTDALRVELAPHGVHVTSVCPALTDTEFPEAVIGVPEIAAYRKQHRFRRQPAADVARRIVRTTGRNRPELVFTAGGKFLAALAALAPRLADRIMAIYYRDQMRLLDQDDRDSPD